MPTVYDETLLDSAAFAGIVREASDRMNRDRPIVWDDLVPDAESPDEDVFARFTGAAYAADIISDDAEAVVHEGGVVTTQAGDIPNLKHGRHLSQQMIERLSRIEAGRASGADRDQFFNWRFRVAEDLTFGLKQRRSYLKACMATDSVAYNRLGIKISGTWNMPASLKATEAVDWNDHANAKPVTAIRTMKMTASNTNGAVLDGAIMSSAAFFHMVQSAEFIARIAGIVQYAVPAGAYSPQDPQMERFALSILGIRDLIIDDATYKTREKDGRENTYRYVAVPKVTLFNRAARGNTASWDFANAITSESRQLARRGQGVEQSGPLGYWTSPNDLNPPNETYWVVQRGFPRKHDDYISAVITTGSYTT